MRNFRSSNFGLLGQQRSRERGGRAQGWCLGFTTIELLVVVAIVAILAAVAAPGFTTFTNNTRASTTTSELFGDLNIARGESIKRNAQVLVCARNTAGTDCAATTNWAAGWLVCYEGAVVNHCAASSASAPNPIVVKTAVNSALTLTFANATTTSATNVRFNPNGTQGTDGAANTLTVGGTWSGAVSRVITIASVGSISKK